MGYKDLVSVRGTLSYERSTHFHLQKDTATLSHLLAPPVAAAAAAAAPFPLRRGEPAIEDLCDELLVLVVDEEEGAPLGRRQLPRLGHDLPQQHGHVVCVKGRWGIHQVQRH